MRPTHAWSIRTTPEVHSFLSKLHPTIKKRIRDGMEAILSDPAIGKNLKNELAGLKSFRVGRYRIIYRVGKKKTIDLIALGPRRFIYEEKLRLLQRTR